MGYADESSKCERIDVDIPSNAPLMQPFTISRDATIAVAKSADLKKVYDQVLEVVKELHPEGVESYRENLGRLEEQLGVKLNDLLESLGDRWCLYDSPGESRPGVEVEVVTVDDVLRDRVGGVDFVKIDDLSRPYHLPEIEAIRKAIDKTGRAIVFSTSPGGVLRIGLFTTTASSPSYSSCFVCGG